jgi:hypothetical protein
MQKPVLETRQSVLTFEAFNRNVADETDDDICVMSQGNTRCLWLQRSASAPAKF